MGKKLTTQEFISKVQTIHGNKNTGKNLINICYSP